MIHIHQDQMGDGEKSGPGQSKVMRGCTTGSAKDLSSLKSHEVELEVPDRTGRPPHCTSGKTGKPKQDETSEAEIGEAGINLPHEDQIDITIPLHKAVRLHTGAQLPLHRLAHIGGAKRVTMMFQLHGVVYPRQVRRQQLLSKFNKLRRCQQVFTHTVEAEAESASLLAWLVVGLRPHLDR